MDSTEQEETQAKFRKVNLNMEVAMMEQIQQSGDKVTDFIQKACAARLIALGLRQPDVQASPVQVDGEIRFRVDSLTGQVMFLAETVAKLQGMIQMLEDEAEEQAAKIVMLQTGSAGNAEQGAE